MTKTIPLYPIQCQLTSPAGNLTVNVLKLSSNAMMVDSLALPMKVNTVYTATFTFVATNTRVEIPVMVYKAYDEYTGHSKPGHHINELVFKSPSIEARKALAGVLGYISAHSR